MVSQNAAFVYQTRKDDPFETPGRELAAAFVAALNSRTLPASDPENWRNCGWSIDVAVGPARVVIAVAQLLEPQQWMLQVWMENQPGFVGRLFGRKPIDASAPLTDIAIIVHEELGKLGSSSIRWRVD